MRSGTSTLICGNGDARLLGPRPARRQAARRARPGRYGRAAAVGPSCAGRARFRAGQRRVGGGREPCALATRPPPPRGGRLRWLSSDAEPAGRGRRDRLPRRPRLPFRRHPVGSLRRGARARGARHTQCRAAARRARRAHTRRRRGNAARRRAPARRRGARHLPYPGFALLQPRDAARRRDDPQRDWLVRSVRRARRQLRGPQPAAWQRGGHGDVPRAARRRRARALRRGPDADGRARLAHRRGAAARKSRRQLRRRRGRRHRS